MIQSLHFQKVRTPGFAVGALALVALGVTAMPHLVGSVPAPAPIVVQAPAPSLAQRPLIITPTQPDSSACGTGAYVSGDLAGDASPAAMYATMCGR